MGRFLHMRCEKGELINSMDTDGVKRTMAVRRLRLRRSVWCLLIVLLFCVFPLKTLAEEAEEGAEEMPPHLIQTVTERDIFEGQLALGLLESPVLAEGDCAAAYENVKNCIVRIHMGNAYGSGVVFRMTPECVIIVTNKHVLSYWDDAVSYVQFPQGYFTGARVLGMADEHDVGFLSVDNGEFDFGDLERLRYVRWDMERYQKMQAGDAIFCTGAGDAAEADGTDSFYQGSVGDMALYIDDFGEYMIFAYGYAREGMSGGGTFDSYGNFIGMISGATVSGETASVPLPTILEAYGNIETEEK